MDLLEAFSNIGHSFWLCAIVGSVCKLRPSKRQTFLVLLEFICQAFIARHLAEYKCSFCGWSSVSVNTSNWQPSTTQKQSENVNLGSSLIVTESAGLYLKTGMRFQRIFLSHSQ